MSENNTPPKPTKGQLERSLAQQFQRLYRQHLNHQTGKVSCRLFDDKLTIVIEDSLTQPEQLLLENGSPDRVEKLHQDLSRLVRPQFVDLIETVLGRKVVDLMSDTTLETARTGLVIVLSDRPSTASSGNNGLEEEPSAVGLTPTDSA